MKIFIGKVISTKMPKTAKVLVERTVIHPIYKKRYKRAKKYQVQDEIGVKQGQRVKFVASRPFSKTKKWKIVEIVGQAVQSNPKPASPLGGSKTKKNRKKD